MAETIYETIKDSDGVECFIKRGNLVRCKDCKYFPSVPQYEPSCWKNRRRGDDPDWFCADGEPK